MNGVRSTFMRRGYLLTALAALLLLAASSGTAEAQSVRFTTTSGNLSEGASTGPATPAPLEISIEISGIRDDPSTTNRDESVTSPDGAGAITITHNLDDADGLAGESPTANDARRLWQKIPNSDPVAIASGTTELRYTGNGRLELLVIDPPAGIDGNWKDEKFTLKVESNNTSVSDGGVFNLTIVDDDVAPVAKFKHVNAPNITLQEDSTTMINVAIEPGSKTARMQGVMSAAPALMAMVTPANAKIGECTATSGNLLDVLSGADGTTRMVPASSGVFELTGGVLTGDPSGISATYHNLTVKACTDSADFRDMQVGLSFVAKNLASGASGADGNLTDGGKVTITVDSNEATPTVSFATSSIDIAEGSTNTVAILADGKQGAEVGMVKVSVMGDAMLSLHQDGTMLEADDHGMYTVDLGDSANTILTIRAEPDRYLEEGASKTATITIEEANGATIGDRKSLMVTVNDTPEVPALPLIAQLLLALFLMAGGSRLYRRRQS